MIRHIQYEAPWPRVRKWIVVLEGWNEAWINWKSLEEEEKEKSTEWRFPREKQCLQKGKKQSAMGDVEQKEHLKLTSRWNW